MTSVAMLQACDSMEDKVKKVLKCGLAVNELGNSTAKSNFNANRMTLKGMRRILVQLRSTE